MNNIQVKAVGILLFQYLLFSCWLLGGARAQCTGWAGTGDNKKMCPGAGDCGGTTATACCATDTTSNYGSACKRKDKTCGGEADCKQGVGGTTCTTDLKTCGWGNKCVKKGSGLGGAHTCCTGADCNTESKCNSYSGGAYTYCGGTNPPYHCFRTPHYILVDSDITVSQHAHTSQSCIPDCHSYGSQEYCPRAVSDTSGDAGYKKGCPYPAFCQGCWEAKKGKCHTGGNHDTKSECHGKDRHHWCGAGETGSNAPPGIYDFICQPNGDCSGCTGYPYTNEADHRCKSESQKKILCQADGGKKLCKATGTCVASCSDDCTGSPYDDGSNGICYDLTEFLATCTPATAPYLCDGITTSCTGDCATCGTTVGLATLTSICSAPDATTCAAMTSMFCSTCKIDPQSGSGCTSTSNTVSPTCVANNDCSSCRARNTVGSGAASGTCVVASPATCNSIGKAYCSATSSCVTTTSCSNDCSTTDYLYDSINYKCVSDLQASGNICYEDNFQNVFCPEGTNKGCMTDTLCSTCGTNVHVDTTTKQCVSSSGSTCQLVAKNFCPVDDTCQDGCSLCGGSPAKIFLDTGINTCVQASATFCNADSSKQYCEENNSCVDDGDCSACPGAGNAAHHEPAKEHQCRPALKYG